MSEHPIRLRGPWEVHSLGDRPPFRIRLPVDSLPGSTDFRVLVRHFGRPARLAAEDPVRLRLEQVPGVVLVSLNGEELGRREADESGPIELPVNRPLQSRNVLELTVAPGPDRTAGNGQPWGSVVLVFGGPDDPPVDG